VKYGAAVVVDGFHPELRSFFLELWHWVHLCNTALIAKPRYTICVELTWTYRRMLTVKGLHAIAIFAWTTLQWR
jgi:hypothetical protein